MRISPRFESIYKYTLIENLFYFITIVVANTFRFRYSGMLCAGDYMLKDSFSRA
jgi:hypothetical protein